MWTGEGFNAYKYIISIRGYIHQLILERISIVENPRTKISLLSPICKPQLSIVFFIGHRTNPLHVLQISHTQDCYLDINLVSS